MTEEEKPELGKAFKRLTKKAIETGIKVSQKAVEESLKTAKTIAEKSPIKPPAIPLPQKPGETAEKPAAKPFTPRGVYKPPKPGKRAYWNPLAKREFPVLEYDHPPSIELEKISGLSEAADALKQALKAGEKRILLVGPPGVGKAVLALAATNELNLPLFDVDSLGLRNLGEEAGDILGEVFVRASQEGRAIVFYNVEWIAAPTRYARIIIYDPYTDVAGDERIIIYDPYTPLDIVKSLNDDELHNWFADLLKLHSDKVPLIVATTSKPWALPPRVRRMFKKIYVGFPSKEDRLEIIKALDPGIPDDKAKFLAIITQGHSFHSLKKLLEKLGGDYSTATISKMIEEVEPGALTLASSLYKQ